MKKYALILESAGEMTSSAKLLSILSTKEEVEGCVEMFRVGFKDDPHVSVGVNIKEVDSIYELFLQNTTNSSHSGYREEVDIVTYPEFVLTQRLMRKQVKVDQRGYQEGKYNGYALSGCVVDRFKISCRDHRDGQLVIALTHKIKILDSGFEITPIKDERR